MEDEPVAEDPELRELREVRKALLGLRVNKLRTDWKASESGAKYARERLRTYRSGIGFAAEPVPGQEDLKKAAVKGAELEVKYWEGQLAEGLNRIRRNNSVKPYGAALDVIVLTTAARGERELPGNGPRYTGDQEALAKEYFGAVDEMEAARQRLQQETERQRQEPQSDRTTRQASTDGDPVQERRVPQQDHPLARGFHEPAWTEAELLSREGNPDESIGSALGEALVKHKGLFRALGVQRVPGSPQAVKLGVDPTDEGGWVLVVDLERKSADFDLARKIHGIDPGLNIRNAIGEELIHAAEMWAWHDEWLKEDKLGNFTDFVTSRGTELWNDLEATGRADALLDSLAHL